MLSNSEFQDLTADLCQSFLKLHTTMLAYFRLLLHSASRKWRIVVITSAISSDAENSLLFYKIQHLLSRQIFFCSTVLAKYAIWDFLGELQQQRLLLSIVVIACSTMQARFITCIKCASTYEALVCVWVCSCVCACMCMCVCVSSRTAPCVCVSMCWCEYALCVVGKCGAWRARIVCVCVHVSATCVRIMVSRM